MYLDISSKEEILEYLRDKVIKSVSLDACWEEFSIILTDGTTLHINAHIPKYEHHAELDINLTDTK
jgi:hypothetical protein